MFDRQATLSLRAVRPTPRVHHDSACIETTRATVKMHKLARVGGRAGWGSAPHLWTPTALTARSEVTAGSGITHLPVSSVEERKREILINESTLGNFPLNVLLIA